MISEMEVMIPNSEYQTLKEMQANYQNIQRQLQQIQQHYFKNQQDLKYKIEEITNSHIKLK